MSGGRTAIVTGGASGIGAACVRRFLKDGISVVALDLNEDLLKKMQAKLNNPKLHIVAGDVCDEIVRGKAIDLAVNKCGSLDILVNNAAIFLLSGIDATREQWQRTFEVNLLAGANLVSQALVQLRKSANPAIVNIASISSYVYGPSLVVNDSTLEGIVSLSHLTNVFVPSTERLTVSSDVSNTCVKSICGNSVTANIINFLFS